MKYMIAQDILLTKEILNLTNEELAKQLCVAPMSIYRWEKAECYPDEKGFEAFYNFAYSNKVYLNKVKESLFKEEYQTEKQVVLFHGAKTEIEGDISLSKSKETNDFGNGFYCGENLTQSAMFVSGFPKSSVYSFLLNIENLRGLNFLVERDWMLLISYYRGTLTKYKDSTIIKKLLDKVAGVDYIFAPIADNRMYRILQNFTDGEITDEQCIHALSALGIGYQFVLKSEKAIAQLNPLERFYLCKTEKEEYIDTRAYDAKIAQTKVKIARIKYRGIGKYIDEILGGEIDA